MWLNGVSMLSSFAASFTDSDAPFAVLFACAIKALNKALEALLEEPPLLAIRLFKVDSAKSLRFSTSGVICAKTALASGVSIAKSAFKSKELALSLSLFKCKAFLMNCGAALGFSAIKLVKSGLFAAFSPNC